jgi:dTDP-L-rhamnose 4-epimerase
LNPYTGVLSVIANQILNNDVVEMYEDGGQTRDLVNVEDVADAHYLASLLDFSEFTAINIATGKMSRLDEVCKKMIEILCPDKKLIFNGKHRMGDVYEVGADNSLARKVLGWIPKHNIVDDIKVYCGYIHANRELFTVGNTIKQENEIITRYNLVRDTNGS